jgi:hypothetical protein
VKNYQFKDTKNAILFQLNRALGQSSFLSKQMQWFYAYILYPFIRKILLLRHRTLKDVILRNSTLSDSFHPFFSDLDITLVIEKEDELKKLLRDYFFLKKIFIMLDTPEVYTTDEFHHLGQLKKSKAWELVEFFWHFRKINWNKKALLSARDPFEILKLTRSIQKSMNLVVRENPGTKNYSLKNFNVLDQLFHANPLMKVCCYYSDYLENNFSQCFHLELSRRQYEYLNSLLPGEDLIDEIKEKVSVDYLIAKEAVFYHELYLSKSALRIRAFQKLPLENHQRWISYLEGRIPALADQYRNLPGVDSAQVERSQV